MKLHPFDSVEIISYIYKKRFNKLKYILLFVTLILASALNAQDSKEEERLVFIGKHINTERIVSTDTLPRITGQWIRNQDTIIEISKPFYWSGHYKSTFKIMDIVRGSYEKDSITIEFYRHTNPIYKSSKVYCIDVSFVEGQDHQVIKMYSRVYRTKNKNWAVPYSRYWHRLSSDLKNRSITIKPENVNFVSSKSYPMQVQRKIFDNPRYYNYSIISDFDYYIQYQFPNPYFKHTKDSILTIYGYYAEDFARLSKQRETYFIINRKETDSLFNQQKARPPTKHLSVSEEQRFFFEQGTRLLKEGYKGWTYDSFKGAAERDPDSPLGKLAQFKADSIINTNRSRLIDSMQGDWQLSEQHLIKNFKSDFMMNVNRIQIEGERMTFMSRLPNNSGIELPIKTEPIKFNDFFIETYDLNEILLPDGSLWLVYASKKTLHFVYSGQVFNEHKRSQYKQSQGAFFSYKFIKETKK